MDGSYRCWYIFPTVCLFGLIFCSYIHLQIIYNSKYELISLNLRFTHQKTQTLFSPRLSEVKRVGNNEETKTKMFLYLVQSESCLPEQLIKDDMLGNGDNRDVIVLNWRENCKNQQRKVHDHFIYIFDNQTTWGNGRNLLYHIGRQRNRGYLYYIFLDEDIDISFTAGFTDSAVEGKDLALRAFERFLVDYRPAVGLTHFCSRCGKLLSNGSYVASLCCSTRTVSSELPLILPVSIGFDAAFNAFHTDIIELLLPYKLKYEKKSWWESQKYVILKADVLFRGQVVRYNAITVLNKQHREYPQRILYNWMDILQEIRTETPSQYQNESVFLLEPLVDMVPDLRGRKMYTPRFNLTIPGPRIPFTPYGHFKTDEINR